MTERNSTTTTTGHTSNAVGSMGDVRNTSFDLSMNNRWKEKGARLKGQERKSSNRNGKNVVNVTPNSSPKGKSPRRSHSGQPCQIFQENFSAFLQSVENVRFKVHKPGCQCSKVNSIRERSSLPDNNILLQGLLVVPDSNGRFLPSAYLYPVTETLENETMLLMKELELKEIIFPPDRIAPDIKVSCAACLLENVPNGFVCIQSSSRKDVEFARDEARRNAASLIDSGKKLHADHAHEVVVLDCNVLRGVARSPRRKRIRMRQPLPKHQSTKQYSRTILKRKEWT
ncbi:hypothetical protein IV203_036381 [Nitzschia inconspicua]|uniref:Uncharacterized protein n=1 Tax=Nitzschia inconspicua TaxID=303405 RepID=A0A9K3LHY1_9STRA|nr:hypothetical protein IV203_036381 [Nitzschia inconspicua]